LDVDFNISFNSFPLSCIILFQVKLYNSSIYNLIFLAPPLILATIPQEHK